MKRFYVHVHVSDLADSIGFYSNLLGRSPVRREPDYARWMLDDPRVNFAISTGIGKHGVDQLGIESQTDDEWVALRQCVEHAAMQVQEAGDTTCCYARSDRHWLTDPQGVDWEHFRDLAQIEGATCRMLCVAPDSGRRRTLT